MTTFSAASILWLPMGGVAASAVPVWLGCFGLGSCVGLFLHDRVQKIGGGVHVMLPAAPSETQLQPATLYADHALEALVGQMTRLGSDPINLRARITGGANVLNLNLGSVGERNVAAVKQLLTAHRIPLLTAEVGGTRSRSVRFCTASGQLHPHVRPSASLA